MIEDMPRRIVALVSVVRDKVVGMAVDAVTEGARIVQTVGEYAMEVVTETRVALPPLLTERLHKIAARRPQQPYEFVSGPVEPAERAREPGTPQVHEVSPAIAQVVAAAPEDVSREPAAPETKATPKKPRHSDAKTRPGKRRREKAAAKRKSRPPAASSGKTPAVNLLHQPGD